MIKKVSIEDLKPGMYIHDFDCGWLQHPFFRTSQKVKKGKLIAKIEEYGIREVYIDTEKGSDVSGAPTEDEVTKQLNQEIQNVAQSAVVSHGTQTTGQELARAREVKAEVKQSVKQVLNDVTEETQVDINRVEDGVEMMMHSVLRNQDALISLGQIKRADEYTYEHSMAVCVLMIAFGHHLGIADRQLRDLGIGAMLHDIGKMKIPKEVLNKQGKLRLDEYEIIKSHVEHSNDILKNSTGIPRESVRVAVEHHERYDGSGYPFGLKGDEISMLGQMVAIVDVYDAITSDRCYRDRVHPTYALRKLYEWSNFHFNSELVQKFIRCVGIYPVGTLVRLKNGLLAFVIEQTGGSLLHPVVRAVYNAKYDCTVRPRDIDLSQLSGDETSMIVSYEVPEDWGLRAEMYL